MRERILSKHGKYKVVVYIPTSPHDKYSYIAVEDETYMYDHQIISKYYFKIGKLWPLIWLSDSLDIYRIYRSPLTALNKALEKVSKLLERDNRVKAEAEFLEEIVNDMAEMGNILKSGS